MYFSRQSDGQDAHRKEKRIILGGRGDETGTKKEEQGRTMKRDVRDYQENRSQTSPSKTNNNRSIIIVFGGAI